LGPVSGGVRGDKGFKTAWVKNGLLTRLGQGSGGAMGTESEKLGSRKRENG